MHHWIYCTSDSLVLTYSIDEAFLATLPTRRVASKFLTSPSTNAPMHQYTPMGCPFFIIHHENARRFARLPDASRIWLPERCLALNGSALDHLTLPDPRNRHLFQGFRTRREELKPFGAAGKAQSWKRHTSKGDVTKQGCARTVSGECRAEHRAVIRLPTPAKAQTGILQLLDVCRFHPSFEIYSFLSAISNSIRSPLPVPSCHSSVP